MEGNMINKGMYNHILLQNTNRIRYPKLRVKIEIMIHIKWWEAERN